MSDNPNTARLVLYPVLAWLGALGMAAVFIFIVEQTIVPRLSWV